MAVAAAVMYALGARGRFILFGVVVGFVPVGIVVSSAFRRIWPPTFESLGHNGTPDGGSANLKADHEL